MYEDSEIEKHAHEALQNIWNYLFKINSYEDYSRECC